MIQSSHFERMGSDLYSSQQYVSRPRNQGERDQKLEAEREGKNSDAQLQAERKADHSAKVVAQNGVLSIDIRQGDSKRSAASSPSPSPNLVGVRYHRQSRHSPAAVLVPGQIAIDINEQQSVVRSNSLPSPNSRINVQADNSPNADLPIMRFVPLDNSGGSSQGSPRRLMVTPPSLLNVVPVSFVQANSNQDIWGLRYLADDPNADPCHPMFRHAYENLDEQTEHQKNNSIPGNTLDRIGSCFERTLCCCCGQCTSPCCNTVENTYCGLRPSECLTLGTIGLFAGLGVVSLPWDLTLTTGLVVGSGGCCLGVTQCWATRSSAKDDNLAFNRAMYAIDAQRQIVDNNATEALETIAQKLIHLFVISTIAHKDVQKARRHSPSRAPQIKLIESESQQQAASFAYDKAVQILNRLDNFREKMKARTGRYDAILRPLFDAAYLVKKKYEERNEADAKLDAAESFDDDDIAQDLDSGIETFPSWEAEYEENQQWRRPNSQHIYYMRLRKEQCQRIQDRETRLAQEKALETLRAKAKKLEQDLKTRLDAHDQQLALQDIQIASLKTELAAANTKISELEKNIATNAKHLNTAIQAGKEERAAITETLSDLSEHNRHIDTRIHELQLDSADIREETNRLRRRILPINTVSIVPDSRVAQQSATVAIRELAAPAASGPRYSSSTLAFKASVERRKNDDGKRN